MASMLVPAKLQGLGDRIHPNNNLCHFGSKLANFWVTSANSPVKVYNSQVKLQSKLAHF